jgi:penicillin-binding protein 2
MAKSVHIEDSSGEREVFRRRAITLFVLIVCAIALLFWRMYDLQVRQHEQYRTRSDENRIQVRPLAPPRGLIFDRDGELIADNRPVFTLSIVPERVGNLQQRLADLAELVELSEHDLDTFARRFERPRRPLEPVPLKTVLSEEEIATLAVNRFRLPGVEVDARLVRFYPYRELMSHAVGSVRRISREDVARIDPVTYSATQFIGKQGVEQFYERSLHGEVGYERVEVDARGRVRNLIATQPPVAGVNIRLHLDSELQRVALEALGERRGAVVAIDPRTGGILALVSNPGYDPNLFVTGISREQFAELTVPRITPLFNRAVNGRYSPGSTIKPVVGLAGISMGLTTWEQTINDRGWFRMPGQQRIYRDWSWRPNNSGGQGIVDLRRAIYRSSNVYFYELSSRMEIDELAAFLAQFGLGQITAIDVAEASRGVLPNRAWKREVRNEPWYPGENLNVSIGQGDLMVTPLQLATMTTVIANRGHWVRPRMLMSSSAPLAEDDPPPPLPPIHGVSPSDWERMVASMEDVVHRGDLGYRQSGTAWFHIGRNIGYRMAGKSGTAQVVEIRQGQRYNADELQEFQRNHAWFIAFAPAESPRIALAVLVEHGGGGSSVAAPVARAVIDAYLLRPAQIVQR